MHTQCVQAEPGIPYLPVSWRTRKLFESSGRHQRANEETLEHDVPGGIVVAPTTVATLTVGTTELLCSSNPSVQAAAAATLRCVLLSAEPDSLLGRGFNLGHQTLAEAKMGLVVH